LKVIASIIHSINNLHWRLTRPITLGVRLLLVKDQHVVLVRHTYQPAQWFLVGGGVKRCETLEEAARREALEEVGADLGKLSLFGVFTNFYEFKNDHVIVFTCNEFTLAATKSFEIEECKLFSIDNLPSGIAPGHRRRIEEYLSGSASPIYGMW
jgi:8-oxo-dGTP pyrophosphatase MutT (NUDIX family)